MSHNSIRSGLRDMHLAIRAMAGRHELENWEAKVLKEAWAMHKELISSSLKNYDGVVVPFLNNRINLDSRMKEGHFEVLEAADQFEFRIKALKADKASKEALKKFHKAFEEYKEKILKYLDCQEKIDLPLMRAYFSPEEVRRVVQQLLAAMTAAETGSLIFYAGEDTFSEFMSKDGGISTFTWLYSLKSKSDQFYLKYVQPLAFVTRGVPLATDMQCCMFCSRNESI
eukprot:Skav204580  [mRNA]  locus=scaffold767:108394:109074:- [translate_table: standard]